MKLPERSKCWYILPDVKSAHVAVEDDRDQTKPLFIFVI